MLWTGCWLVGWKAVLVRTWHSLQLSSPFPKEHTQSVRWSSHGPVTFFSGWIWIVGLLLCHVLGERIRDSINLVLNQIRKRTPAFLYNRYNPASLFYGKFTISVSRGHHLHGRMTNINYLVLHLNAVFCSLVLMCIFFSHFSIIGKKKKKCMLRENGYT